MKSAWKNAVIVALIHIALVSSLGAKLLYDRATRPRVWVRTQTYDPNLPIRGRYAALTLVFPDPKPPVEPKTDTSKTVVAPIYSYWDSGKIVIVDGKATVQLCEKQFAPDCMQFFHTKTLTGEKILSLNQPVLFFLPDTAADPQRLQRGDQLWVEVTLPRKGPPRPIQLAVSSKGQWKPLDVK